MADSNIDSSYDSVDSDDDEPVYATSLDAFCAGIEEDFASAKRNVTQQRSNSRRTSSWVVSAASGPITTQGHIPRDGRVAYIYIAKDAQGCFKVGMSVDPRTRAIGIKARMVRVFEVPARVAKSIETETLRICGHRKRESEWTDRPYLEVKSAVLTAMKRHGLSLDLETLIG